MQQYWQEIITFILIGIAIYFLIRRYFLKPRQVKGIGADECKPCSTGTCDGCAVLDLKRDIDEKKSEQTKARTNKAEKWEKDLNKEILLRKRHLK